MGATKQKWTAEEEFALKAGVQKHGIGKWRNILNDPEFSMALRLRSNIDLKDKWRNMSRTESGGSVSKERAKLSLSKVLLLVLLALGFFFLFFHCCVRCSHKKNVSLSY